MASWSNIFYYWNATYGFNILFKLSYFRISRISGNITFRYSHWFLIISVLYSFLTQNTKIFLSSGNYLINFQVIHLLFISNSQNKNNFRELFFHNPFLIFFLELLNNLTVANSPSTAKKNCKVHLKICMNID